eukprot:3554235-Rhodomonas_salina.1
MSGTDIAYGTVCLRAIQRVVLWAYIVVVHATPCLVLTQRMVLRRCYAMSGTDLAYAPTSVLLLLESVAESPTTPLSLADLVPPPMLLRLPYAISGTHIAHPPTSRALWQTPPEEQEAR